jgi:hypothetical protein
MLLPGLCDTPPRCAALFATRGVTVALLRDPDGHLLV